jgi:hypothetical protein
MFVQSGTPVEVGSEFTFRFHIEEWSPIKGEARVVWVRRASEDLERPAGMGVEFTQLDAQSRRMIRWLVDKHLQEGEAPFDLGKLPVGASRSGPSQTSSRVNSLTARSKSKSPPAPLILIWAAILGAVAFGTYYWWESRVSKPSVEIGSSESSQQTRTEFLSEDFRPDRDETAVEVGPQLESDPAGVPLLVDAWAAAWKDRRPDDLLRLYADEFEPPRDLSRDDWEEQLRERFAQPEFILVAISGLKISFPDENTANATFYRSIRTESGDDSGRIALDLAARDEGWMIVRERAID